VFATNIHPVDLLADLDRAIAEQQPCHGKQDKAAIASGSMIQP